MPLERRGNVAHKLVLREDKILEKWSVLIQNAKGKGSEIVKRITNNVEEANVPGMKAEMAKVFPKMVPGFLDTKVFKTIEREGRDYLMIRNSSIDSMLLLVGAQDYGKNLFVSWYLICEPRTVDKVFAAFSGKLADDKAKWMPVINNIFMEEELTAYVTLVHHCVLNVVEGLMSNMGEDYSKIDRKSRGFLGIS